jgi:hypothetical protein
MRTGVTVSPAKSEPAATADPTGAGTMPKDAPVAKCEDLSEPPSLLRCDTGADSEMAVEFQWHGHWEVWEMEWGGPRWVWDDAGPGAEVPGRES